MKLNSVCDAQQNVFNKKFCLDLATNTFDYLGGILSYMVIAIPVFSGAYDDVGATDLSRLISENAFVCMYLVFQFSILVDLAVKTTDLAGATHRVGELVENLRKMENGSNSGRWNRFLAALE